MTAATTLKHTTGAAKTADAASESRIDRDSHFNGLYETKQNLRIEGISEGEIRCDGTLTVADGARVKAKVTATAITIAGELEGEVVCQGVFQIMPTGKVAATVSARKLSVQEGGFYNGEFHMITEDPVLDGLGKKLAVASVLGKQSANARPAGDPMASDEWWAKMSGVPADGKDGPAETAPN